MIGFGLGSHWLKNWRESFKPITKRSNRNHVITFESHLKTALISGGQILPIICNIFKPGRHFGAVGKVAMAPLSF